MRSTTRLSWPLEIGIAFWVGMGCAVAGPVPQPVEGGWTLVMIPDTQNYVSSSAAAGIFTTETEWIAASAAYWNIRLALHVGDLVDDNSDTQWERAVGSLAVLEGVVPYALCTGNHDCGPGGSGHSRDTQFTQANRFGIGSPYAGQTSFGGYFQHPADTAGNTQNSWHAFEACGMDYLVLTAEWGPRDGVIAWMGSMAESHPFHRVIILVHAYLKDGDSRFGEGGSHTGTDPHHFDIDQDPDGVNDGEDIWQKLGRKHENLFLVSCGHAGRGTRTVAGDAGNRVHEMLYNTQDLPNGGNGWLRLLHFYPDGRTIKAYTYSPHLEEWDRSSSDEFQLGLDEVSSLDSDSDALPDWFELAYGLEPMVSDGDADADGDGIGNHAEYLAATDPTDASDRLQVTALTPLSPDQIEIRWAGVPGVTYTIQSSGSVRGGWEDLLDLTAKTADPSVTVGDDAAQRRFFRAVVR